MERAMKPSLATVAVLTFLFVISARSAFALECPAPQETGKTLVSEEEMKELGQRLANDESGNGIDEAKAELRAKDPKVTVDELVDVLVGAYCTWVASEGIDDDVARQKVQTFAKLAYERLAN
jgi:hypothetical protein